MFINGCRFVEEKCGSDVVLVECFLSYKRKLSLVSVTANSEGEKIATKQIYM